MSLLGDDGLGYELARKLEERGVWRTWLGDSNYATFIHSLASLAAWDAFMRVDESKSKSQLHLQLRARALLFDKAAVSLSNSTSVPVTVSNLNAEYFQLNGSDVYFTLENGSQESVQVQPYKSQSKAAYSGSRYGESEFDNLSQRFKNEELPETWYEQFFEKYKLTRPYKLSYGDRESDKRTPEGMSEYLRACVKNKRRHIAFQQDQYMGFGNSVSENTANMHPSSVLSNSAESDIFFPETMFTMNCVPDTAHPPVLRVNVNHKVDYNGVFDNLPPVTIRSPVKIERLGIKADNLGLEHQGKIGSERCKKSIGEEQASQLSQKVTAHILTGAGFESATEVPLQVFSQLLSSNISKLGRILNVLASSYKGQCSAIELFKMFFQVVGVSNIGSLAELVKDSTRTAMQHSQEQVHGMQSQQHSALRLPQQIQRQMHQQMQQMIPPQNLVLQQMQHQQQLERMHRLQASNPRPGMDIDKDQAVLQNIENRSEMPMDPVHAMSNRQQQMQFRQQQLNAMSSFHAQANNFRPSVPVPIPQMHSPSMGVVRAPPVKVGGFQELMGGDASSKHDSEENKLTSPDK